MSGKSGSVRTSLIGMAALFGALASHGRSVMDFFALGGPAQSVRKGSPRSHHNGGNGRGNVARSKRAAKKRREARKHGRH